MGKAIIERANREVSALGLLLTARFVHVDRKRHTDTERIRRTKREITLPVSLFIQEQSTIHTNTHANILPERAEFNSKLFDVHSRTEAREEREREKERVLVSRAYASFYSLLSTPAFSLARFCLASSLLFRSLSSAFSRSSVLYVRRTLNPQFSAERLPPTLLLFHCYQCYSLFAIRIGCRPVLLPGVQ